MKISKPQLLRNLQNYENHENYNYRENHQNQETIKTIQTKKLIWDVMTYYLCMVPVNL